jgi:hypothetical protein
LQFPAEIVIITIIFAISAGNRNHVFTSVRESIIESIVVAISGGNRDHICLMVVISGLRNYLRSAQKTDKQTMNNNSTAVQQYSTTVQYDSTVQYSTVQYSTVQYSAVQYSLHDVVRKISVSC